MREILLTAVYFFVLMVVVPYLIWLANGAGEVAHLLTR